MKIVKLSVSKFRGDPKQYDEKDLYDTTGKLKSLLDAMQGKTKSCLAKFLLGSDKYREVWIVHIR